MIYILTALKIEASPIINFYKLKKSSKNGYQIFENDNIVLTIFGVGEGNCIKVVDFIKQNFEIKRDDIVINFGICGAKNRDFKIGEFVVVNQLLLDEKVISCDKSISISSFDYPLCEEKAFLIKSDLVDMESCFIYKEAQKFFDKIYILKVVSDYLDITLPDKNFIYKIINQNIKNIANFIEGVKSGN